MPIVIAPLLLPLLAFLLCLFLWASSQAGQTFFRALFQALNDTLGAVPIIGRLIGKGIDWLIHHTVKPIADFALAMETPVVHFFNHLAGVIEGFAFSAYYTAARAWHALYVLRHVTIPHLLDGAVKPITRTVHVTERIAGKTVTRVERVGATGVHSAAAAWRLAAHALAVAEAAIAVPADVAGRAVGRAVPQQLGYTWKTLRAAWRRIRALPEWLTVAGVGAVAVFALGRIGAGWVKCSNWRKIGKTGCRLPSRWLDDLLSLAADFLIITNVCTVLPYLTRVAADVGTPLIAVLTRAGAGLCRGASRPPTRAVPTLHLPDAPSVTLYLPE